MSIVRGGETITIQRKVVDGEDAHGNKTSTTTNIKVREVLLAIGGTSEPVDPARDAEDATLTLYLPQGTRVEPGDVFVIRGSKWVKDGMAQEWVSPFPGLVAGVVVPVRKRRG